MKRKPTRDLEKISNVLRPVQEAILFTKRKSIKHLEKDRKLLLSLTKEIEIMGEAASQISKGFQKKHPELPWGLMIATRNRLVHGDFDIDPTIIWNTVKGDFPPLIRPLKKILRKS